MANGKAELTLEQLRELNRPYFRVSSCNSCGTVRRLPNGDFEHDDPCVLKDAIDEAERAEVKMAAQLVAEAVSCWRPEEEADNAFPISHIADYLGGSTAIVEIELANVATSTVFGALINGEPKWFLSRKEAQAAIDAAAKGEE